MLLNTASVVGFLNGLLALLFVFFGIQVGNKMYGEEGLVYELLFGFVVAIHVCGVLAVFISMDQFIKLMTLIVAFFFPVSLAIIGFNVYGDISLGIGGVIPLIAVFTITWFRVMCFCLLLIIPVSYFIVILVMMMVDNHYRRQIIGADEYSTLIEVQANQMVALVGWSCLSVIVVTFIVTYVMTFKFGALLVKDPLEKMKNQKSSFVEE